MGNVIGVSVAGPVAGQAFALVQSACMGGAAAATTLAWWIAGSVVGLVLLVLGTAAGVVFAIYHKAQQHLMGVVTGLLAGHKWLTLVHNWHHGVEVRSFATRAKARNSFVQGGDLRRIMLRLNDDGDPLHNNGWNWHLPWREHRHSGWGTHLDNEMRKHCLDQIRGV